MVRQFTPIEYLGKINEADGIREAVDVVEKLNEILNRKQIETDTTIGAQQKKDDILGEKQAEIDKLVIEQQELVSSIQARMKGRATEDTRIKADALGTEVKRRIAEAKEQGKEINNIVIDDNGIKAGNSRDDGEER